MRWLSRHTNYNWSGRRLLINFTGCVEQYRTRTSRRVQYFIVANIHVEAVESGWPLSAAVDLKSRDLNLSAEVHPPLG
jgi:hypothetical protein